MGEVVDLPVITSLDLDPQRVLAAAVKAEMTQVIIIGYDKDGDEYFSSSVSDGADALWHLERAKLRLLKAGDVE